ncbi:MAG: YlmC/YmxH family sporulation protein [Clostridia bacterium]|nr:YlmC/YmxH family sporulation protein [Clostridia bacterium]
MSNTTFSELREKEIINICDGARLGTICDLELDDCTGLICSIVVPGPARMLGLIKNSEELVIPFCKIQKIGDDVILVDINDLKRIE